MNYSELKENLGLHRAELDAYIPLSIDELKNNSIKCITYSYYHKWHPQGNYYYTRDNSEKFKLSLSSQYFSISSLTIEFMFFYNL